MTTTPTPASPPELCPVCMRFPILKAPTGEGCLRFGQVKRDLYATAYAEAECYRKGLDLRESALATTQARLDALVAEREHLEEAARLCRFTFDHAIDGEECSDAEADTYGEAFKAWAAADRSKAGR